MKRVRLCIDYRLRLITPVHVGTGVGGVGFLDGYTYRSEKEPVIPGSTIKGRLRAAVRALTGAGIYGTAGVCKGSTDCTCLECLIFGRLGSPRGSLYFDDACPVEGDAAQWIGARCGIGMDRYRRVARDGALYAVETAGGANLLFQGRISGAVPEEHREQVIKVIRDAFAFNHAIGFGKSRGLGWSKTEMVEERG